MARVETHVTWWDRVKRVDRRPGDVYHTDDARARQVLARLPEGHVTVEFGGRAEGPDLSKLTNAQLAELCGERGIKVPKKATKATLIELLEG